MLSKYENQLGNKTGRRYKTPNTCIFNSKEKSTEHGYTENLTKWNRLLSNKKNPKYGRIGKLATCTDT